MNNCNLTSNTIFITNKFSKLYGTIVQSDLSTNLVLLKLLMSEIISEKVLTNFDPFCQKNLIYKQGNA